MKFLKINCKLKQLGKLFPFIPIRISMNTKSSSSSIAQFVLILSVLVSLSSKLPTELEISQTLERNLIVFILFGSGMMIHSLESNCSFFSRFINSHVSDFLFLPQIQQMH